MAKNVGLVFVAAFAFSLFGCATVQTFIGDRADYVEFPIETRRRFIFDIDHVMGAYRMEDWGQGTSVFEGDNGRILRRGFSFHEGDLRLSRVELLQRETSGIIFSLVQRFVRFVDNSGRSVEYEVDFTPGVYLSIQDPAIGRIDFNYIMDGGRHTGFDVLVNGERFGILALYPQPFRSGALRPSFFLRRGNELSRDMAMYILAAHLSQQIRLN
ncbi:MAG: hypothetical protein FWE09_07960 [Treponema sp.]|nr:hypothetical protein [Treponema sp.]